MICLDNSDWMRNGDYTPTRLQAQMETVNYIANAKIQDNQESVVGLLSMADSRVQVHCSMTRSMGQIMNCLKDDVQIGGKSRFINGLKIAQLGLKNRQNKSQKQRIVMFVGSPVEAPSKDLVKLGKVFKKNKVSVDIINFGAENSDNVEKLEAFMTAINSGDSSHLVNVPPGPHVLADLVLTSSIMTDSPNVQAGMIGSAGAGADAGAGGPELDANMDQDLAMAIRMSMEDERQRQEAAQAASAPTTATTTTTTTTTAATATTTATTSAPAPEEEDEDMEDDEDEDALLAQAIALSMAADGGDVDLDDVDMGMGTPAPSKASTEPAAPTKAAAEEANADDDQDDIAAALRDKDFLENLLSSVPGMDKNDLAIDDILLTLGGAEAEEDSKDEKKKDDQKK